MRELDKKEKERGKFIYWKKESDIQKKMKLRKINELGKRLGNEKKENVHTSVWGKQYE